MRNYFFQNLDGSVAMIAGLTLPVIVVASIGALEASQAIEAGKALQRATDASLLAMARHYYENPATAKATGNAIFEANCPELQCGKAPTVRFKASNGAFSASASSEFPGTLLRGAGLDNTALGAYAEIGSSPTYKSKDLHFLLDMSGSMNIPDGPSEIQALNAVFQNPWSNDPVHRCSFACHRLPDDVTTPYTSISGFDVARANGIYLREDRVRDEMSDIFKYLSGLDADIGSALYTIGAKKGDDGFLKIAELTDDFKSLNTSLSSVSSESHSVYFPYVSQKIVDILGQTEDTREQTVVMITDGYFYYGAKAEPVKQSECDAIKGTGAELIVLELEYADTAYVEGDPNKVNETEMARSDIRYALRQCASPGRHYVADYGDKIGDVLQELTENAIRGPMTFALTK